MWGPPGGRVVVLSKGAARSGGVEGAGQSSWGGGQAGEAFVPGTPPYPSPPPPGFCPYPLLPPTPLSQTPASQSSG